ncbi:MAG: monovalent cation/H(+) antiporter subunit G [Candidatus Delongbacteria bacterium]|nr:monovalent cation/H(+) antiporter subunit G [Candidatus Delongbacteria bacterium]MCG2759981.1 monovalent cation/H(+) antiporter subunit G [Candidatus Delongbacteria bacterium]
MSWNSLLGSIITLLGSIFLFLGALGVYRMPDLYNRMQAGTKSTTLGTMLTLLGIGICHYEWLGQVLILIIFIALTNPISSHALARAAHFKGIPLTAKSVTDKLKEEESKAEVL